MSIWDNDALKHSNIQNTYQVLRVLWDPRFQFLEHE